MEATSAEKKEMMGLMMGSAYDEEEKEVTLEFVSIICSQVSMDKVHEILIYPTLDFHVLMAHTPCLVSILVYK